jgi:hypothetical protein
VTLWEKLIRNCVKTPSGCWSWQGAVDKDGYTLVRVGKQVRRGHDVAWEIHNGRRIPPGYQSYSRRQPAINVSEHFILRNLPEASFSLISDDRDNGNNFQHLLDRLLSASLQVIASAVKAR